MGPKLSNAVGLFIDGVRDGHLSAALEKYVAARLVEHSPGIADERAGLAAAFEPLVRHGRRTMRPLRGFEDGSKVFLHTVGLFGWRETEQVRLDIFDTDDADHLIEHWGVAAELGNDSRTGYSQVDGPMLPEDLASTERNKNLIQEYVHECLIGGAQRRIPEFRSADGCVEHDLEAPCSAPEFRYVAVEALVGCGNLVATFCDVDAATGGSAVGDLFRIHNDKIVEHWDVIERRY